MRSACGTFEVRWNKNERARRRGARRIPGSGQTTTKRQQCALGMSGVESKTSVICRWLQKALVWTHIRDVPLENCAKSHAGAGKKERTKKGPRASKLKAADGRQDGRRSLIAISKLDFRYGLAGSRRDEEALISRLMCSLICLLQWAT